jgi:hypothetical protein
MSPIADAAKPPAAPTRCVIMVMPMPDVAQYVYSKDGKAYSVVDRDATDARVQIQIEIPQGCDVVRGLLMAVHQGLKIDQKLSPVVRHDRIIQERRQPPNRRGGASGREERVIDGYRRRHTYDSGRGGLHNDGKERQQRRKEQYELVHAQPRRGKDVSSLDVGLSLGYGIVCVLAAATIGSRSNPR